MIEVLKLVTIEVKVGLRLHFHDFWHQHQCVHILLTTFYHTHHYTMQLLGIWSSVHMLDNMNITGVPYVHVGDVLQDVNDDSIPQSLVNRFAEEK